MKIFIAIAFVVLPLSISCVSPMGHLDAKVSDFKKEHPESFRTVERKDQPLRSMHVISIGDPTHRPVVFVHGSPGDWTGWVEFLMDPNLSRKFHLMAVDRPGFGQSRPGQTERSLRFQAEDVGSVLSLNTSHKAPIFVGHSFGGAVIAQWAADQNSEMNRAPGLIFVASSVDPDLEKTKWFQIPADWIVFKWMVPTALRVCNEEILALKAELTALSTRWDSMNVKVITIHGTEDDLVPIDNQKFIRSRLEKSLLEEVVLKDMNHFIPWRAPETIRSAIEGLDRALD